MSTSPRKTNCQYIPWIQMDKQVFHFTFISSLWLPFEYVLHLCIHKNTDLTEGIWLVSRWTRRDTKSKSVYFEEQKMLYKLVFKVLGDFSSKSSETSAQSPENWRNSLLSHQTLKWRLSISPWPVLVLETSKYQKIQECRFSISSFWISWSPSEVVQKLSFFTWSSRRFTSFLCGNNRFDSPRKTKVTRRPSDSIRGRNRTKRKRASATKYDREHIKQLKGMVILCSSIQFNNFCIAQY